MINKNNRYPAIGKIKIVYSINVKNKKQYLMTTWSVLNIIGWIFLVASWVTPRLMKNDMDKSFIGGVLAALACGVFIGGLVVQLMN